jgi:hypothetical protein
MALSSAEFSGTSVSRKNMGTFHFVARLVMLYVQAWTTISRPSIATFIFCGRSDM